MVNQFWQLAFACPDSYREKGHRFYSGKLPSSSTGGIDDRSLLEIAFDIDEFCLISVMSLFISEVPIK